MNALAFWFNVVQGLVGKEQQVAQQALPSANEVTGLFTLIKSVFGALYLDIWWLALAVFFLVYMTRKFLHFVDLDVKEPVRLFGVFPLKKGWWPFAKDCVWVVTSVIYAGTLFGLAKWLWPASLHEVARAQPVIVGAFTYGLGTVLAALALKWAGVMKKLEPERQK